MVGGGFHVMLSAMEVCNTPWACHPLVHTRCPLTAQAEYRAINKVFAHDGLRLNSTKSMIGHLLGGAGAVEAVATVSAITTGWLHPSINLEDPEEGVDLARVCAGSKQQHDVNVALSNSFGFGGHNSCIMFRKWRE
jgi:3-oxoacyl-[acyl-carrier-protein] synthase II